MMVPVKVGVIAELYFNLSLLMLFDSLLSVPCIKSFKPSFTAFLNKLNRLDNLSALHSIIIMLVLNCKVVSQLLLV